MPDDLEDYEVMESALRHLIEEDRPKIAAALIKGHGGEPALMKALFSTTKIEVEPGDDDDSSEDDNEPPFNSMARVLSWIVEGMP